MVKKNEIVVETESYRLVIQEKADFTICVTAAPYTRRLCTDDDVKEIEAFLANMGKWEAVISSTTEFLRALGFENLRGIQPSYSFGRERYDIHSSITEDMFGNFVSCAISLEENERKRREGFPSVPVEEIRQQIENVPKWLALKKALSSIGGSSKPPS